MAGIEPATLLDLTQTERAMVEAVVRGEPADLKRGFVRGSVLRDLILEARRGWTVPPAGICINQGIVDGGLDLEGCSVSKPLLLWHSRIQGGGDKGALIVRDARLKRLGIHSCTVEGPIIADRVQIESGFFLGGGLVRGLLQIRGAEVNGALAIEGTEIGDGKTAIAAAGVRIAGPLILRRAKVQGEMTFPRAHLGSGIYAEDAQISHSNVAVNGESSRIEGDVLLERAHIAGGIKLANARIAGRIAGDGLVSAGIPDALIATGIHVEQGVSLANAKLSGAVWFDGAEIGKVFRAESMEIEGGETALHADIIEIGGNWDLARARIDGVVSFPGARINGQLRMTEARIRGGDLAIRADGAAIRGGWFVSRATITGLVRLPSAEIGNQFRMRAATLKVDQGAALLASGTSFARDVELNGGFQSVGAVMLDQTRIRGVCDLQNSALKSSMLARGGVPAPSPDMHTGQTDDLVLSLVDANVDRLHMPERAEDRPKGIVELTRARIGSLEDYASAWPPPPGLRGKTREGRDIDHLVLDGLAYDHLANPSGIAHDAAKHIARDERVAEKRIQWLEGQLDSDVRDHFKPQAWVVLAKRLSAQGYTEDARAVSIARRRRERRSRSATWSQRLHGVILDLFALYGYNPWRTVVWMTVFVLLFAGIWSWAASHCERSTCLDESVFVVRNRDAYTPEKFDKGYPEFNALAYSFDVFVPFVSFGYEDHWRPNLNWAPVAELPDFTASFRPGARDGAITITMGGILYVLGILETVLGLILSSLLVTGFTGLLRDEE